MSVPPVLLPIVGTASALLCVALLGTRRAPAPAAAPQRGGGPPGRRPAGRAALDAALDAAFRALLDAEWTRELEWSRRAGVPPAEIERANAAVAAGVPAEGGAPHAALDDEYEAKIRAAHEATLGAMPSAARVRVRARAVASAAERSGAGPLQPALAALPAAAGWRPAPGELERAEMAACGWRELRPPRPR